MNLSDFDLGWIAAAIDGEGTVSLYKHATADTFYGCVLVSNTNDAFIACAHRIMGPASRINIENVTRAGCTLPLQKVVLAQCAVLVEFLEQVTPHLVIKQDKAVRLLTWARGEPERRKARMGKLLATQGRSLVTESERRTMKLLYDAGMSAPDIARAIDRTKDTVYRTLKSMGFNFSIR